MNIANDHEQRISEIKSETGSIEEVMSISSTSSMAGSFENHFENVDKYVQSTMSEAD